MKKILVIITTLYLISYSSTTLSLEKDNGIDSINSSEGYPYNMLIQRTDKVKLIYNSQTPMTCRVEVHNKGQVWQGQSFSTSHKRFMAKPLTRCMDRELAKDILSSTF